ncbi:hypothetical protein FA15DRAFT_702379 [Coprinopsis marcescibilis]|uniref:Transmembrane protein n=1 Tax=Coprinopsis marcescibilis TaxID=230819 RepID=A0A5C3L2B5_COPMA|nr:hypothetical protein FA15DRAFT_702379 [Coprinopsis marcescibilis]
MAYLYANITTPWSETDESIKKAWKKVFCANVPEESPNCPFGPCPNPDVTGIGSQISIYITTVVFAISVLYIPSMQRPMVYAHLSVIYSLMIAALVCLLRTELTANDGVFVLICVASPSTLYLWFLSVLSFWKPQVFPIEKENKRKSKEVHILRILSLLSLCFEIALICLIFNPTDKVKVSQPDCTEGYATSQWYNLAWILPLAIQSVASVLYFLFAMLICWLWVRRQGYEVPPPCRLTTSDESEDKVYTRTFRIDLITWTERILLEQYPNLMSQTLVVCLLSILQILVLPSLFFPNAPSPENILSFVLLAFGCFWERPREGANPTLTYALRGLGVLVVAGVGVLHTAIPFSPSIPDVVLLFLACTVAVWSYRNFSIRNLKAFLPVVITTFVLGSIVVNLFMFIAGSPSAFSGPAGWVDALDEDATPQEKALAEAYEAAAKFSPMMVTLCTVPVWFVLWSTAAFWPWRTFLSFREFLHGLFARAHILKFCAIILLPHILWIQSCVLTNPSDAAEDMNFGQIFSLIVSVLTLISLIDEAIQVERPVWIAVMLSKPIPETSDLESLMAMKPGNFGFGAEASVAPRTRARDMRPAMQFKETLLRYQTEVTPEKQAEIQS